MGVLSFLVDELDSDSDDGLWLLKVDTLEQRNQQLLEDIAVHARDHREVRFSRVRHLHKQKNTKPRYSHVTIK